ncbi:CHAT domain-containing protein [Streptomyces sp. NPDC088812]|uniref:CHAT domain-containing protein n=1 Tax=Streptomyces sp. NPDC088812 TaxID=3365905 RepID=UPI0037F82D88
MTLNAPWALALSVLAAVLTVRFHWGRVGLAVDERALTRVELVSHAAGAFIGTAAGGIAGAWVLRVPLGAVVGWGSTGVAVLAATGVLVGSVLSPGLGLGAMLVYGVWHPVPQLTGWWAVPLVVGAAVGVAWRAAARRWRGAGAGDDVGLPPPSVGDRVARAVFLLAATGPVAVAVLVPLSGADAVDQALRLVGAALISAQLWAYDRPVGTLTRPARRQAYVVVAMVAAGAVGLAASSAGAAAIGAWRSVPGPGGLAGGLLLVAVDLACVRVIMAAGRRGHPSAGLRVGTAVAALLRGAPLQYGLAVFAAVALFHPAPDLLPGALLLVVVEAWELRARGLHRDKMVFTALDTLALDFSGRDAQAALRGWVHDGFLHRRGHGDYTLVAALAVRAVQIARGTRVLRPPSAPAWPKHAVQLLATAEQLLDMIDREVMSGLGPEDAVRLRRTQALARAYCAVARANLLIILNERDKAVAAWHQAASLQEEAGAPNSAAGTCAMTALLLTGRLEQYQQALDVLQEPLERDDLDPLVRRHLLIAQGVAFFGAGDLERAAQSSEAAKALRDAPGAGRALRREVLPGTRPDNEVAILQEMFQQSETLLERAIEGQQSGAVPAGAEAVAASYRGVHPLFAVPAMRLTLSADSLLARGRPAAARRMAQRALRRAERDGHLTWVHQARLRLAMLSDSPGAAYAELLPAIAALEEMRSRVLDPGLRVGALDGEDAYHAAMLLLAQRLEGAEGHAAWPLHPAVEAFDLAERVRSRVFLELLGSRAAVAPPPGLEDLVAAQQKAEDEYQETVLEGRAGRVDPGNRIRRAHGALERAWQAVAAAGPAGVEYAQLRRGIPLPYSEIQALLDSEPGVVLAQWCLTPSAALLFVSRAHRREPDIFTVDLTRQDVRDAVNAWRADPASPSAAPLRQLVAPLASASAEGELLWLVPHDALHLIPLQALEVGGRPLVERNPVCATPSASVLRYCRNKGTGQLHTAVVLADSRADRPIAHARAQAQAIADLFAPHAEVRVGEDATAEVLRTRASATSVDLWHIACHGELDASRPMRSGVLLAPTSDNDGRLTAADLFQLLLRTELVTLSVCDTALSTRLTGDELIGLTRALIHAGAPSVLVSLWSADEISTSVLMQAFYRALPDGKAAALRHAQRTVRALTVAEAIAHCEELLRRLPPARPSARTIARDIADLQYLARDFAAAAAGYEALADMCPPEGEEHGELQAMVTRCRRAQRTGLAVDYALRPYEHPHYWAAFTLVGDWN